LAAAVTETLHGIRRFYAELRASGDDSVTARQKGELRLSALERVIDTCGDDPGGIRDAALLALGFFGAFRRSELAALRLRDIDDNGDRMTITLTRSKTDQEGNGHVKAFVQRTDAAYCPVRLLRRWLSIRGTDDPTSFVFVNVHRKGAIGCRGLDGKDVARRLKLRAERAGIDVSRLGGHSLRIGFVTEARRRGAVTSEIQRQTGHRTERMITHYTRTNDAFEMNAVTRF
jgi:integrase